MATVSCINFQLEYVFLTWVANWVDWKWYSICLIDSSNTGLCYDFAFTLSEFVLDLGVERRWIKSDHIWTICHLPGTVLSILHTASYL